MWGRRGRRIVRGDVFRRLVVAREYMRERHQEPIVLQEAARVAGISPFHFLRTFARVFDETPHAYLQRIRLERARDRLARGTEVTEVCFDVGYASVGSFSVLFRRKFGRPPSVWQRDVRRMIVVPEAFALLHIPCRFLYGGAECDTSSGPKRNLREASRFHPGPY